MKIKKIESIRADKKVFIDDFATTRWFDYFRSNETHMNELASWVADSYNVILKLDASLNRTEIAYMRRTLVEPMLQQTWNNKKLK